MPDLPSGRRRHCPATRLLSWASASLSKQEMFLQHIQDLLSVAARILDNLRHPIRQRSAAQLTKTSKQFDQPFDVGLVRDTPFLRSCANLVHRSEERPVGKQARAP